MSVSRLYRLGQQIDIKFRIEGDEDESYKVDARLYDCQGNQITDPLHPAIAKNMVKLSLPEEAIEDFGDYIALFHISNEIDPKGKDLPVYFAVATHETTEPARGTPADKLTANSSSNELEQAVAQTLKSLRQHMDAHEAERHTMNTARAKTGQDLIPLGLIQKEVKSALSNLKILITA